MRIYGAGNAAGTSPTRMFLYAGVYSQITYDPLDDNQLHQRQRRHEYLDACASGADVTPPPPYIHVAYTLSLIHI